MDVLVLLRSGVGAMKGSRGASKGGSGRWDQGWEPCGVTDWTWPQGVTKIGGEVATWTSTSAAPSAAGSATRGNEEGRSAAIRSPPDGPKDKVLRDASRTTNRLCSCLFTTLASSLSRSVSARDRLQDLARDRSCAVRPLPTLEAKHVSE